MNDGLKRNWRHYLIPTKVTGPKPGDYPLGSIESRAAARATIAASLEECRKDEEALLALLPQSAQASARAMIEEEDNPRVRILVIRLVRVALERAIVYGQPCPLPTPEELRHNRAVRKEIEGMIDGSIFSAQNDSVRWNKLKAIAEANLRAKKK
jgi:hypothetical protein